MNTKIKHTVLGFMTALVACTILVTTSMAETPKTNGQNNNEQATYPYGMPGGMMGPGYGGYRGMGPGNMPYGGMGPGYMRQGGRGYGGMGYGMGYGGMGMMGYGMGYGGMGMMQALNLDKAQRSKIRALMRAQRTANCKLMTEMMDVRDELAAEYDKDQPNAKVIGKTYEKMQAMQRQMLERMVETHNKMREVLNKEQKENFDHMFQGGMGMMNMMGGGMMGYGGWNTDE